MAARNPALKKKQKKRPPKDRQVLRVYAAEAAFDKAVGTRYFDSLDDIRANVERIMSSDWLRALYPDAPAPDRVIVIDGRGSDSAAAERRPGGFFTVRFPRGLRYQRILLHELAHVLEWTAHTDHGVRFCAAMLAMVRNEMGVAAARTLSEEYARRRVAYAL